MSKTNNIYFTNQIIDSLVEDTINKVPGIDKNEKIKIVFNNKANRIDVEINVMNGINNLISIAEQAQNYLFIRLCRMFDLKNIQINLTIK
jgi:hypothetical protein